MEHRHLRFFIAVAEELSFSRAAERLNTAQPHLSREIRRLEEEMAVTLFNRDQRRISLTPAGTVFLHYARRVVEATSEAISAAQRAHIGEAGTIRVGCSSSAIFGFLPNVVRDFRQQHPEVELKLTELNSDMQPDLIYKKKLDVGLLYAPRNISGGLNQAVVAMDTLVVALPNGHPLTSLEIIGPEALRSESWVYFPQPIASLLHETIRNFCARADFTPSIAQEASKLSTIVSLVAAGVGIALVPVALQRLALPGVVFRPLAAPAVTIPLSIVWRKDDQNVALKAFLDSVLGSADLSAGHVI